MNIFKTMLLGMLLAFSLALTGCQGSNSDPQSSEGTDTNSSHPSLPDQNTSIVSDIKDISINVTSTNKTDLSGNNTTVILSDSTPISFNVNGLNKDGGAATQGEIGVIYPSVDGKYVAYLGEISPNATTTLSDGSVSYLYTPPTNIEDLIKRGFNGATFTFYDLAKPSANYVTLKIDFTSPPEPDHSGYTLTAVPTAITVTAASQSKVIDLYVEDNNLRPAENEVINVDYFDGAKGTMNSFSATTDANGHVSFNYTAPATVTDGVLLTMTFRGENSTLPTATTAVSVDTTTQYTNYVLSIVDQNRTISQANQQEEFNLYVKNSANNTPVNNTQVILEFFDGSKGTVDRFSSATDTNGKATFLYSAPADISDLNATEFTFKLDVNNSQQVKANLFVESVVQDLPKITLSVPNNELTLTQNSEQHTITVNAYNSQNEVFTGTGSIEVKYPSEITDNGVSGGTFSENNVVLENGQATFTFNGPAQLDSNVSASGKLVFSFIYKDSYGKETNITKNLTVTYSPEVPTLILPTTTYDLTKNSETVSIEVDIYDKDNNPYSQGSVKVQYPSDVRQGRDVGRFKENTVAISSGKAIFEYTAPNNLDGNTSDIDFTFYHDSGVSNSVVYKFTIHPDPDQVVLTSYDLSSTTDDGKYTMELNSTKQITFSLKDADGVAVADSNITSIIIKSLNPTLATLKNSDGNESRDSLSSTKNNVNINVDSGTVSGVVPLEVNVNFHDINNQDKNVTKVFNIVILSGPPSAVSLSYVSTTQDSENAKFIETWALSVTDKYSNRVNTNPSVSMGMIAGYAIDATAPGNNPYNYIYYEPSSGGTLETNNTFKVNSSIFDNVDSQNDVLALFGNGYTYDASGKWEIAAGSYTDTLTLEDDYNGTQTANLGFAVGNNYRQDQCEQGTEWIGRVYPKNNNYKVDDSGNMLIQVDYDYYLAGKDVVLWANFVGYDHNNNKSVRIGEAKKITLRAQGIEPDRSTIDIPKNTTGVYRVNLNISNTVESYRNARYRRAVNVKASDSVTVNSIDTSWNNNIASCNNSGQAYVDINVTSDANAGGTVDVSNFIITNEF